MREEFLLLISSLHTGQVDCSIIHFIMQTLQKLWEQLRVTASMNSSEQILHVSSSWRKSLRSVGLVWLDLELSSLLQEGTAVMILFMDFSFLLFFTSDSDLIEFNSSEWVSIEALLFLFRLGAELEYIAVVS